MTSRASSGDSVADRTSAIGRPRKRSVDQRLREDDRVAAHYPRLHHVVRNSFIATHVTRHASCEVALVAAGNAAKTAVTAVGRREAELDDGQPASNRSVAVRVPVVGVMDRLTSVQILIARARASQSKVL